ncbi:MAG: xanthine dehydrogenase accessory protein XdhC [Betaproteobacteria bacterium]
MLALTDLSEQLLSRLSAQSGVLVTVARTQGSVPRERGTWMAVFDLGLIGTIGGGHLEAQAIAHAQNLLKNPALATSTQVHALGPSLGQCCGGRVELSFERVGPDQVQALRESLREELTHLGLFGGGHVGQAIVQLMLTLPYAITWIDSRDQVFPSLLPSRVRCEHSQPVEAAVHDLPPGSQVLIMSFSHAEDLDIVSQCLLRQRRSADFPFVGLIGSATKWAVFQRRLLARGFSQAELGQITSPIGLPGIQGKAPSVIALAVAAQLMMRGLRSDLVNTAQLDGAA